MSSDVRYLCVYEDDAGYYNPAFYETLEGALDWSMEMRIFIASLTEEGRRRIRLPRYVVHVGEMSLASGVVIPCSARRLNATALRWSADEEKGVTDE